jgi:hypothetical protein
MPRHAQTKDDWIANHVYGMTLLRQGDTRGALKALQIGSKKCPWSKQRRYFDCALAIAKLREQDFSHSITALGEPTSAFEKLILLHANGALGNLDEVRDLKEQLGDDCPPVFFTLRDSLVDHYLSGTPLLPVDDLFCVGGLLLAA